MDDVVKPIVKYHYRARKRNKEQQRNYDRQHRNFLPRIHLPWEPLEAVLMRSTCGVRDVSAWARLLGVDRTSVRGAESQGWVSLRIGDQYAIALKKHPVEVWGAAFYADIDGINLEVAA